MGDSFWAGLDEAFYTKYPEEWDNDAEFVVSGEDFTKIIEGKTNKFGRKKKLGEKVDDKGIFRNGRYVWKIGTEYDVKDHRLPLREVKLASRESSSGLTQDTYEIGIRQDGTLGKIRLVKISKGIWWDTLYFEKVS